MKQNPSTFLPMGHCMIDIFLFSLSFKDGLFAYQGHLTFLTTMAVTTFLFDSFIMTFSFSSLERADSGRLRK